MILSLVTNKDDTKLVPAIVSNIDIHISKEGKESIDVSFKTKKSIIHMYCQPKLIYQLAELLCSTLPERFRAITKFGEEFDIVILLQCIGKKVRLDLEERENGFLNVIHVYNSDGVHEYKTFVPVNCQ